MTKSVVLKEPFQDAAQQREAGLLGMHLFLATEIMLFGGLFAAIFVYRVVYPEAVAQASGHLYMWLGGLNTAVLLTSSLFMALAVEAARRQRRRPAIRWLLLTAALGTVFLGVKGFEYFLEYREGLMPGVGPTFVFPDKAQELFLDLYFVSTGLHSIHLSIGIVMVVGLAFRIWGYHTRLPERAVTVEMFGLYWHLVDVVWVFLYPVLYLARG